MHMCTIFQPMACCLAGTTSRLLRPIGHSVPAYPRYRPLKVCNHTFLSRSTTHNPRHIIYICPEQSLVGLDQAGGGYKRRVSAECHVFSTKNCSPRSLMVRRHTHAGSGSPLLHVNSSAFIAPVSGVEPPAIIQINAGGYIYTKYISAW